MPMVGEISVVSKAEAVSGLGTSRPEPSRPEASCSVSSRHGFSRPETCWRLASFPLDSPSDSYTSLGGGMLGPSDLPTDEHVKQADQRKLPFEDSAAKGNSGSNPGAGNSGEPSVDSVSKRRP